MALMVPVWCITRVFHTFIQTCPPYALIVLHNNTTLQGSHVKPYTIHHTAYTVNPPLVHPRVGDQVPDERGEGVVVERRQRRTRTHILARVAVEPRDPPHGAPTVPYVAGRRVFGSVVPARKRGEGEKERWREEGAGETI